MSGRIRAAYWVLVATGCVGICAGGAAAFSAVGVVTLLVAAGFVVAAAVIGAVWDRSLGAAAMPFTVALAVLVVFPLVVNVAFWAARGP